MFFICFYYCYKDIRIFKLTIYFNMYSTCNGCYPVFQPNQIAHSDAGGCLYCSESLDDIKIDFQKICQEFASELIDDVEMKAEESASEVSNETNTTECCICFENIDKHKNNCTTECGHSFCLKCLATSIVHNNSKCPYCRTNLVDIPDKNEEDEEDIGDEDEEDEEYDEEHDDEYDDEYDENAPECEVEEITSRLEKNGFTMQDIVCMLLGRYKKDNSEDEIYILNKSFNNIIDDADKEASEQELFAAEDFPAPGRLICSI